MSAPPYFEDLQVGTVFEDAPALTLTEGHAALHQAIAGDRLRLALDRDAGEAVIGAGPPLAHPALVCDVAIGQSTVATDRVIANLFYRGLLLRRPVADRRHAAHDDRGRRAAREPRRARPTGLAVLRIRTIDQEDRPVLDFTRCAMLPAARRADRRGRATRWAAPSDLPHDALLAAAAELDLGHSARARRGRTSTRCPTAGPTSVEGGDAVDSAPGARATDAQHRDGPHRRGRGAARRRLVYGGHTIGLAAAHAARALPGLVTILAWHSCDHLAPVFEGDTLRSRLELEQREALAGRRRARPPALGRQQRRAEPTSSAGTVARCWTGASWR